MGHHLAVGANSFARSPSVGDGANKFAPTMMPCDIQIGLIDPNREAAELTVRIQANPVGANSFAPLMARMQMIFERLGA